jgi:hypothetical protein
LLRAGAAALIAGVYRRQSIREVHDRLSARPVAEQAAIVGGVFSILFALGALATQFGWVGVLAFWLAVIVLVN